MNIIVTVSLAFAMIFIGLLFAVPVTAILGVIVRHYVEIYFASEFYTSKEP